MSFSCRSSILIYVSGPEKKQPKENPDYGKRQKTKPKLKQTNKLNYGKKNFKKILGCLPKSALFNVVISMALNLNVLRNLGINDCLLYFFWCVQWNGLLIRMELAPKVRLQPLVVNFECSFLWMRNCRPPCGKTWVIVNGPDHLDFNFPGKSLSRELNKMTCCPASNSFM